MSMYHPDHDDDHIAWTESRQPSPEDFRDPTGRIRWEDFRKAATLVYKGNRTVMD